VILRDVVAETARPVWLGQAAGPAFSQGPPHQRVKLAVASCTYRI